MERLDKVRLSRRDMLKLTAGGAGMFALTSSGLAVSSGLGSSGSGNLYIEAFPTSPLILSPFNEALTIPKAAVPIAKSVVDGWESPPGPDNQDFVKGAAANKHQLFPGTAPVGNYPLPIVYQLKLEVAGHDFTSSMVQPIDSNGRNVRPPGSANANPRKLPQSTIYGFNGTFPGPMINFEYTSGDRPLREPPRRRQRLLPPGLRAAEPLVHHAPAQRPHCVRVGRQPGGGLSPLQPARARRARGRLRARGVGGQPVPGLPGRRRRP